MSLWIQELQEKRYNHNTMNAVEIYKYLIDNFSPEFITNPYYQSRYFEFFLKGSGLGGIEAPGIKLYFKFLKELCEKNTKPNISDFETILRNFYKKVETAKKTNDQIPLRVETSLTSKAIHMCNHHLAIYDSNINLSLLNHKSNTINKNFDKAQSVYEDVNNKIQEKIKTEPLIINEFTDAFGENTGISDEKILDFYYWKIGDKMKKSDNNSELIMKQLLSPYNTYAKCGVCGTKCITNTFGYDCFFYGFKLDTRPVTNLTEHTISLQRCEHCGYVNTDIKEADKDIHFLLESEKYKNCNGMNVKNEYAKDYIRYALIQARAKHINMAKSKNYDIYADKEFWAYMNAAWACDDTKGSADDAIICRKKCLELINSLILLKKDTDKKETSKSMIDYFIFKNIDRDKKELLLAVKADLLRRTRQFDALIVEFENKIIQDPQADKIIRFELDLAKAKDAKIYNMRDIDEKNIHKKNNKQ